ncbi:MAG: SPOR domain-containing protein [Gammaproteobacteria bacterium]|nr:SPOR domain-containing protein [Gammaproteobacteria bacterium]
MKKTKHTLSDLIIRTEELEGQVTKIKGRLDVLSFHRHKHRNRLKLLAGDTQHLDKRLDEVEHQLPTLLSMGGKRLAKRWRELQKQYKALRKSPPKKPVTNLPKKLKRLKSALANLSGRQRKLHSSLKDVAKRVATTTGGSEDLRQETSALKGHIQALEAASTQLLETGSAQEARILDTETLLAEIAASQQDETWQRTLEAEVDALQRGIDELRQDAGMHAAQYDKLERQLKALDGRVGEREAASTAVEDPPLEALPTEAQESRLLALENRLAELGELVEQFSGRIGEREGDLEKRLGWVESEIIRLAEASEMLQEGVRELGSQELNTHARLETLNDALKAFGDTAQQPLADGIDDQDNPQEEPLSAILHRLHGLDELAGSIQDRIDALQQSQDLLIEDNERFSDLKNQLTGQLDRIEAVANADRERTDQLQAEMALAREHDEAQQRTSEESGHQQYELEEQIHRLSDELQGQLAQLGVLSQKIDELDNPKNFANNPLTIRLGELEESSRLTTQRYDELSQAQHSLLSQVQGTKPMAEAHSKAIGTLRASVDELTNKGNELEDHVNQALSSGKSNRLALSLLTLLLLLGGAALYWYLSQAAITQENRLEAFVQSQLSSQESEQQLTQQFGKLESMLVEASRRIEEIPRAAAVNPSMDMARIDKIEAQLADLAQRPTTDPSVATGFSEMQQKSSDMTREMQHLAKRLAALESKSTLPQQTAEVESSAARITDLQTSLAGLSDRLLGVERDQQQERATRDQMSAGLTELAASLKQLEQRMESPVSTDARQHHVKQMQPQRAYAIQLAGAYRRISLERFYQASGHQDQMAFFRTTFNDRDWYILLYGKYENFSDASRAFNQLPDYLRVYGPWIRRIPANAEYLP